MKRSRIARGVLAAAVVGGLAVWAPAAAAPQGGAPAQATTAQEDCSGPGATPVPNQYDQPFCVHDDELFIFAANYKPFETSVNDVRQATRFFDTVIGDKLRAAFPNVDIKYATWDYPIRYEDLERAGVVPDIILENPRNRIDRALEPRGWVQDMTGIIEQSNLDVGKINDSAVELVKSRSDGGMYGVPVFINDFVMFYNKKIFDKFGEKYPKPGATYDRIYKLARKLTVQDGLDAYKGFQQHPDNYLQFNQLGLYPFVPTGSEEPAPADVEVDITSPGWSRLGENIDRFLNIPRNTFTTVDDFLQADMSRPGHVAMAVDSLHKLPMYAGSELYIDDGDEEDFAQWAESVEIGVSSVPVLGKGSEATYQPNTIAAFVPPQSDQQAKAFEVVKWLVSEEAQTELSRHAIKGVVESDKVVSAFGEAVPELEGIDTSAIYWGENAKVQGYENTEYWDIPMYMVFRQHVLTDGMTPESALVVTETEDIPAYIRWKADAGERW